MYQFGNTTAGFHAWKLKRKEARDGFVFRHFLSPFHASFDFLTNAPKVGVLKTISTMKKTLIIFLLALIGFSSASAQEPFLSEVSYSNQTVIKVAIGVLKDKSYLNYKLVVAADNPDNGSVKAIKIQTLSVSADTLRELSFNTFDFSSDFPTSLGFDDQSKITIGLLNANNIQIFAFAFNGGSTQYGFGTASAMLQNDNDISGTGITTVQLLKCPSMGCAPGYTDITVGGINAFYKQQEINTFQPSKLNSELAAAIKANTPLPVTFLGISAVNKFNANEITWSTASEENNDYFLVEKLQSDNKTYVPIAKIKGGGTTVKRHDYSCVDENPFRISYYRVSSYDIGSSKIASSITVSAECEKCVTRKYWSYAGNILTNDEPEYVRIFDIVGRLRFAGIFQSNTQLEPGMYFVNNQKIVIQ